MEEKSNIFPSGSLDREGYVMDLHNANQKGQLIELSNGVMYGSLQTATARYPEIFRSTVLVEEFATDGTFILVPWNIKLDKPVIIRDRYSSEGGGDCCPSTNIVLVGHNSELEVLYELVADGGRPYKINKRIRFFIGDNARFRLYESINNGPHAEVYSDTIIYQTPDSITESVIVKTGSGYAKLDYKSDMKWPGTETRYSVLYMVGGEESADVNVTVNHNMPDCRSDVLVKGIASGNAKGSFTGIVYVAPDAQHTEAYQQSRNLLLSDTAQILASPQLEIYADDVKCSHGATVGRQDSDEIYYMRQRGLSEEQARTLQLGGFVNDIIDRIPEGRYRDMVSELAQEKLSQL